MLKTILRSMRIPFLILTPASIFLGFATSYMTSDQIQYSDLFLVLLGALLAHISVNMLNEYHDFRSGLDAMTTKTPFSGGSGALIENPQAVSAVFSIAVICLILTIFIGTYFVFSRGMLILPLGVIGIVIILTYTQWLNRHPFLCLIAPGIGFGPLIVIGTHVVLTGEYSSVAGFVSLVPFFLANNLLLLNQYPDIAADKSVGRRHFPIVYGERRGFLLYGVFVLLTCGVIVTGVLAGILPGLSFVGLIPMGIAVVVFSGAMNHATSLPKLMPYLGMNVAATILTPVFLGGSMLLGSLT